MKLLDNAKSHFRTITAHRHKVMEHCFRAGIGFQGLFHDLSKYSPTEFIPGMKYYQGDRSPNEKERETIGYSNAWMHHKGRNRHHYEFWTDYNPETKKMSGVKMPVRYFVEMVCDRMAASKTYRGADYKDSDPLEYFAGRKGRLMIHPKTARQLEIVLTMLAEKGEDETFRFLRKIVHKDRVKRIKSKLGL
ncbi:MAG: DUF5662 family protein [Butyrivibrio sp.]|nr:DUF5662 family protein [Butyrivibrio sp.]